MMTNVVIAIPHSPIEKYSDSDVKQNDNANTEPIMKSLIISLSFLVVED